MKTIIEQTKAHSSRTIAGIIIFIIGAMLLIDQLDLVFFPDWLFSWPMILIGIGIYSGVKHNFQNKAWFTFILLGVAFLLVNSGVIMSSIVWPAALILLGIYVILRQSNSLHKGW